MLKYGSKFHFLLCVVSAPVSRHLSDITRIKTDTTVTQTANHIDDADGRRQGHGDEVTGRDHMTDGVDHAIAAANSKHFRNNRVFAIKLLPYEINTQCSTQYSNLSSSANAFVCSSRGERRKSRSRERRDSRSSKRGGERPRVRHLYSVYIYLNAAISVIAFGLLWLTCAESMFYMLARTCLFTARWRRRQATIT